MDSAPGPCRDADRLFPAVYDELRRLAAGYLRGEAQAQTLTATALVHEAYLRLAGGGWESERHFYNAAALAMRRLLVDRARSRRARRRGGGRGRVDLDDVAAVADNDIDLLALDEALAELAKADPEAAEVVHLRFFAGRTLAEAAALLGVSPRSADRLWAYARAWLYRRVADS